MRRLLLLSAALLAAGSQANAAAEKGAAPAAAASGAGGQADPKADPAYVLFQAAPAHSIFSFDYGPPTSPALTLLGLTPGNTPPSSSLTKFILSIPSLDSGVAGQSIALDVTPAALVTSPDRQTFDRYVSEGWFHRLGYRTRVSVAALNGNDGGGDASKAVKSRLAIGFSASLLDQSDPLMAGQRDGQSALLRCLAAVSKEASPILELGDHPAIGNLVRENEVSILKFVSQSWVKDKPVAEGLRQAAAPYIPGALAVGAAAPPPPGPPQGADVAADIAALKQAIQAMRDDPHQSPSSLAFATAALAAISHMGGAGDSGHGGAPGGAAGGSAAAPVSTPPPAARLDDEAFKAAVLAELKVAEKITDSATDATSKSIKTQLDEAGITDELGQCSDIAARTARFAPRLDIGGGFLGQGAPGRLEKIRDNGAVAWLAFKAPIGSPSFKAPQKGSPIEDIPQTAWMAFASGRFGFSEDIATGNKTTPQEAANTIDAWVGIERLAPTYRLAAQYGWVDTRAVDAVNRVFDQSGSRYLISGQVQLGTEASPVWLGVSYGNGYGTVGELKALTAMVTLTFAPPKPPDLSASSK